MGIPFFGLGLVAKKHKDNLAKTPVAVTIAITVAGVALTLFSRICLNSCEVYIGSLLMLAAPVILSIKYENVQYPAFITTLAECSTFIYIFHIMVKFTLHYLFVALGIDETTVLMTNLLPIINCVVTTVLALVWNRFYTRIKPTISKLIKI